MKASNRLLLPLILLATAGTAFAQTEPITRAQVQAELAEARRTGDLPADDGTGMKLYQTNPNQYPARPSVTAKSRDQVKAELAEAIRSGNIVGDSETGAKLNEIVPSNYPVVAPAVGKSRAQVQAETAEARRLGLLNADDGDHPRMVTLEQAERIRLAGLRAISGTTMGQLTSR